jgi:hypothetical protein
MRGLACVALGISSAGASPVVTGQCGNTRIGGLTIPIKSPKDEKAPGGESSAAGGVEVRADV